MTRVLIARAGQTALVALVVATLAFALIHLAPGDPFAAAIDNPTITPAIRAEWRRAYGLDRPIMEQYARYVEQAARGNLGWSFTMQRPVREVLAVALPNTLLLMGAALLVGFALGIITALFQVRHPRSLSDRLLGGVSLAIYSMPDFWLALMLLFVFSLKLGVLPAGGALDPILHESMSATGQFIDRLRHLALPATTLALIVAAIVARYQRAALLEVMPREFIRAARSRGVSENALLRRHALRNALLPTITLAGLSFPALLGGAVFVEKIFAWPGMGLLAVNAIYTRDYAIVTAVVLIAGLMVTIGNFVADLLYAAADPRLRAE